MARKDALLKLRQLLIRRRDALRKTLSSELTSLTDLARQTEGDVVDLALDAAHEEITSQLAEAESRELAQIENALEQMRDGHYGQCEACNQPISLVRLKALPYATLCIECQRESEKSFPRGRHLADWGRVPDDEAADDLNINDIEIDVT